MEEMQREEMQREEMQREVRQEDSAQTDQRSEFLTARKFFSGIGLRYLAGTLVIFAVQLLAIWIGKKVGSDQMRDTNIYLLVSMIPMYLIGMPALILMVKRIPAQQIPKKPIRPGQFFVAVILCFAAMYIFNIVGQIITTIIGIFKNGLVQNDLAVIVSDTNTAVVFIIMVVCAPVMEEYVFRKLIVDRAVRYGQATAVVLSGLMFGLFHGNLNQFMYATALGMLLAFLYVKTGKLQITIAIHMLVNFVGSILSLKLIELAGLDQLMANNGAMDMAVYLSEHLAGFLLYMLFGLCVITVMIAGLVLFIVFLVKRKFTFAGGQCRIPRGRWFRTVILNIGMALYCLFWIERIIEQLLA